MRGVQVKTIHVRVCMINLCFEVAVHIHMNVHADTCALVSRARKRRCDRDPSNLSKSCQSCLRKGIACSFEACGPDGGQATGAAAPTSPSKLSMFLGISDAHAQAGQGGACREGSRKEGKQKSRNEDAKAKNPGLSAKKPRPGQLPHTSEVGVEQSVAGISTKEKSPVIFTLKPSRYSLAGSDSLGIASISGSLHEPLQRRVSEVETPEPMTALTKSATTFTCLPTLTKSAQRSTPLPQRGTEKAAEKVEAQEEGGQGGAGGAILTFLAGSGERQASALRGGKGGGACRKKDGEGGGKGKAEEQKVAEGAESLDACELLRGSNVQRKQVGRKRERERDRGRERESERASERESERDRGGERENRFFCHEFHVVFVRVCARVGVRGGFMSHTRTSHVTYK